MKKILGYKKFNSKKGNPVCLISVQEEFSDYDVEHSTELVGTKVSNYMALDDDVKVFDNSCIGKELSGRFVYGQGCTMVYVPKIK